VNNRLVLNGLLEELGLAGQTAALLRSLDKLPKIGREAVQAEMAEKTGVDQAKARRLLDLAETQGPNDDILGYLAREFGTNQKANDGIRYLSELVKVVAEAGVAAEKV